MLSLKAIPRKILGKNVKTLRKKGEVPAVLYGPKAKPASLSVKKKEFDAVFRQAGESSLVSLDLEKSKTPVLIREVQRNPVSGEVMHVDFYQPRLDEKIRIKVPLMLQGQAPAVKDLEGTLIQNIHEVEVAAFPQDLPHEIVAGVHNLKTFEDRILVQDLPVDPKVEILAEKDWIVAQVVPAQKLEEVEKPAEQAPEVPEKEEEKKEGEGKEPVEEPKA